MSKEEAGKICSGYRLMPDGKKIPSGCNQFKPFSEFQKRVKCGDGLAGICKQCMHLLYSKEGDSLRSEELFTQHIDYQKLFIPIREGYFNGCHYRDNPTNTMACYSTD